jgi:hypothetical protein
MTRRLMVSATVCSVVLLLLLCWAVPSLSEHREVNVHIIPHSHCDPGWLTTFEVRYNSLYHGTVKVFFFFPNQESGSGNF